jgi:hypothetical protein
MAILRQKDFPITIPNRRGSSMLMLRTSPSASEVTAKPLITSAVPSAAQLPRGAIRVRSPRFLKIRGRDPTGPVGAQHAGARPPCAALLSRLGNLPEQPSGPGTGYSPGPGASLTQLRQTATSEAINAGPRKIPTSPNDSTPPRIPSSTHRNGSFAPSPMMTGRTK